MSSISAIDFVFQNAIPQTAFGIFMIGIVLGFDGFAYGWTIRFFRANVGQRPNPSMIRATFFFILCTQLLALTQLASIVIWAAAILLVGVTPDWFTSIRLSASSYTTLGDFPSSMPGGWHLTPAFMAFSGLFSFAWASSSIISMLNSLNKFLDAENKSTD
ncbi:hypothetical protein [Polynucleobacter asymbioticus]|uniref:Uncharacterized protein n=1 Tax=Polynucleobacter asymbioticus TaxID=576611 RepID=A0AAC9NJ96_9BURK|nr:hypothetical protein [Polynucleobacter asymbioticus]APB99492.1 hypothetical protein A4F89_09175 [Polynucleobacter asymbioticus]APC01799.1 hypothetical protein AOC25_09310 [Polynucleobacter asymbioticus]